MNNKKNNDEMNVLNWCLAFLVLTTVNSLPIDEDGAVCIQTLHTKKEMNEQHKKKSSELMI